MNALAATLLFALLVSAAPSAPAGPRPLRVKGVVVELTADRMVVQEGKQSWEIGRNGNTRVVGHLRVGARVTVEYRVVGGGSSEGKAATAAKAAK
jgi:hypothetical protein